MIKGWKNSPYWRKYFDDRKDREVFKLLTQMIENQKKQAALQREQYEEVKRHIAECHAKKEESGELLNQSQKTVN